MQCLRQKLSGGGVGVFLFWQGRVFRVCSHDQERVGGECTVWTPCGFKVTVSIPTFDLFPHPRITPFCIFSLTYSCTCLELFLRRQSMQVHDLAKNEWILFTAQKWMQSTHGNSDLR
jgi:hypothetical protein